MSSSNEPLPQPKKGSVAPCFHGSQAIESAATVAESRASFVSEAQAAREKMLSTGKGFDVNEVHAYLKARIAGNNPVKPKAKSWRS
jgi:hypothetical protein